MAQQVPLNDTARADESAQNDGTHEVAPDVAYQRLAIVNVAFVGVPNSADWVLIDAGPIGAAPAILHAAKKRFGETPPRAIVMTHGHFDHFGALEALLKPCAYKISITRYLVGTRLTKQIPREIRFRGEFESSYR